MLEPLESRIAPAVTVVSATTATFTDADGDLVTIKISKGDLNAVNFLTTPVGVGDRLDAISFGGLGAFDGTNLTISVKRQGPAGDGLTYLGHLDATNINLGNVSIRGDLEEIDCGTVIGITQTAIKSLKVHSFGRTDVNGAVDVSAISGRVGNVVIATDFANERLQLGIGSELKSLRIGGSIVGGSTESSGFIQILSPAGAISIGGSIVGGSAVASGVLSVDATVGKLNVKGSLIGGAGISSGRIVIGGEAESVHFGGSIIGGSGNSSGSLLVHLLIQDGIIPGDVASLAILGSIIGGKGSGSGRIDIGGAAQHTHIVGSIIGGEGPPSGSFRSGLGSKTFDLGGSLTGGVGANSGAITIDDSNLQAFRVGGSLAGGTGALSGNIFVNGSVAKVSIGGSVVAPTTTAAVDRGTTFTITESVGSFLVGGDLLGNSINPVAINVNGQEAGATPQTPVTAIGTLKIGGSAVFSNILTGGNLANPTTVKIGTVSVGRDWVATNLSAGVARGPDNFFGTDDDAITSTIDPTLSSISKVIINGRIFGTSSNADHFGIVAKTIGSLKVGGFPVPLGNALADPDNIPFGNLFDLNVREDV